MIADFENEPDKLPAIVRWQVKGNGRSSSEVLGKEPDELGRNLAGEADRCERVGCFHNGRAREALIHRDSSEAGFEVLSEGAAFQTAQSHGLNPFKGEREVMAGSDHDTGCVKFAQGALKVGSGGGVPFGETVDGENALAPAQERLDPLRGTSAAALCV